MTTEEKFRSPMRHPIASRKTDRLPAVSGMGVAVEAFNAPEYTLYGIGSTLQQGIASENNEFKHQKLCEAYDFLRRYKAALTAKASVNAQLLEALKRIRVNIQCTNPADYSDADKLDAVLLMVNEAIAAAEKAGM